MRRRNDVNRAYAADRRSSIPRPSRNGQDERRGGAVKVRQPRDSGGGAQRSTLYRAEHRTKLTDVMAVLVPGWSCGRRDAVSPVDDARVRRQAIQRDTEADLRPVVLAIGGGERAAGMFVVGLRIPRRHESRGAATRCRCIGAGSATKHRPLRGALTARTDRRRPTSGTIGRAR